MWYNSCNNDAELLKDGGTMSSGFPWYATGVSGDAYAGDGFVYAQWDNILVSNVFNHLPRAWDDTAGSTIDLYFRGDHWSTHVGDSGLFAIVDRYSGYDGFYILSVRDGVLRIPYRNSANNENTTFTGASRLTDNTTYRLTVRQNDTALEVYLDGVLYGSTLTASTYVFPQWNTGSGTTISGGRKMLIGSRGDPFFTGILQAGEWVDEIAVYNGYYLPSELPLPGATLAFTDEPDSTTVIENTSLTFSNAFTGLGNIQWYSNSVPIDGATLPTYTITSVTASMSGDQYRVVVSNINYTITSSNATVSVSSDVTKPTIVSVQALGPPTQVMVAFSEPVTTSSAENTLNYNITNTAGSAIDVTGATLGADTLTVTLTTGAMDEGSNYVLVVSNIQDQALIPNTILPGSTAPFTHSSLVGHWKFEEGSGASTADSGLGGFTGTLVNSPTWIPGKQSLYALDFDGANDRVVVGNPAALQLTGPMTLAAWAWPDSFSGSGRIVTKGGAGGSRGWSLNVESTDVWRLQIAVDANTLLSCSVPGVPLNTWTHVVGVYDPNDVGGPIMKLYLNGVLAGMETFGVPVFQHDSAVNVSIGARSDGTTLWNGKIDDVRIYARALTDADVAALILPEFQPPVVVGDQLTLTWIGQGSLQAAPAVTGTYTNVIPPPTSPYTVTVIPGENKFFRLQAPAP